MSRFQTLTEIVGEERAWNAQTIDATACWSYPLSEDCLAAFDVFIEDVRYDPRPITEIPTRQSILNVCDACLQPMVTAVNGARGFAIVEGVPVERYSVEEAQAIYWMIGQFLGLPFAQNVKGCCSMMSAIQVNR